MTQNPPPDLPSLPNELLAKICVYAVDEEPSMRGKNWLRAVRLTCKLLYTPATDKLAKRFFKSLAVMVSRRSLQELVTFCKHDLIGPYIQEIVFHPCQLNARFLSMKRLILDEVYLHGEWDQVLSCIAERFSLEYFKLSKARTVVDNPRTPRLPPSARFVSRYSKHCELKSKGQVCQDLNMFIELQKVEGLAKEAKKRGPPRLKAPRRSARIAKNKTSKN